MGKRGHNCFFSTVFIFLFVFFVGAVFTNCNVTVENVTIETGSDSEDDASGVTSNDDDGSTVDEDSDTEDDSEDEVYDQEAQDDEEEDVEEESEEEDPEEVDPSYMWLHVASVAGNVFLRWTEPAGIGGPLDNKVFIRRSASETCPTSETGTLIYNGTAQVFEDTTVVADQTYCYKIWFDNDGYESPISGGVTEGSAFTDEGIAALIFHNQSTGDLYEWRLAIDGLYKSVGRIINDTENTVSPDEWSFEGLADLDAAVDEDLSVDIYPKDIVWRNDETGALYYWLLNGDGTQKSSGAILVDGEEYPVTSSWTVKGFADLNAGETSGLDYYNDIIWQNSSGTVYYWLLEKTENGVELLETCDGNGQNPGTGSNHCIGLMYPDPIPTESWSFIASGNFLGDDADPTAEVVWQSLSTGSILMWELDEDGVYDDSVTVLDSPGTQWSIIKVIDFNFDGNADILLKNTSTDCYYIAFLQSDGDIDSTQMVYESAIPSTYSVVGVADVNGDDVSRDIVWQSSSTGALYLWILNADGTVDTSETILESFSLSWQILASPEY